MPEIKGCAHFSIPVSDLERSTRFYADVVGMTIASECIVAGELGLEYAALCVVDNLANGLAEGELDVAALEDDRLANAERLREGLAAVLPRLGAVGR